jgi:hypothetical protein
VAGKKKQSRREVAQRKFRHNPPAEAIFDALCAQLIRVIHSSARQSRSDDHPCCCLQEAALENVDKRGCPDH